MKTQTLAVVLVLATAVSCRAVTKEDLRRRYPTLEAAAHAFGAVDVNHTKDHQLILTASFAPVPGQWGGMVDFPEDFQGQETGRFELDHVILHNGRTLRSLQTALRPDITVWDDPLAKISRGRARYRIGEVHEDLRVEVFPELRDAFPGEYVWIPALGEVYESPFALPRVAYTRVAFRRPLRRGGSVRFALTDGSSATFRVDVVRHFGDERRFLVANRGKQALILGEMYPFANPETHREEKHYYRHAYPLDRKPQFALFNELAGFEVREAPVEPADPTIVYGVKLYPRYLSHFEKSRGPVLRAEVINPGSAPGAAAPAAKPSAAPSPAPSAAPIPPVPEGPISIPAPEPVEGGTITPIPGASPGPDASGEAPPPPPPPADASGAPPPPPPGS